MVLRLDLGLSLAVLLDATSESLSLRAPMCLVKVIWVYVK